MCVEQGAQPEDAPMYAISMITVNSINGKAEVFVPNRDNQKRGPFKLPLLTELSAVAGLLFALSCLFIDAQFFLRRETSSWQLR